MATLKVSDLFKAVGLATGAKNVNTLAGGALLKLQNSVNAGAEKLGKKIGVYTGGNIFSSLEKGAKGADTAATDQLISDQVGFSFSGAAGLLAAAAALLGGYFLLKD